jgi:GcrA cell cycle regulator
MNALFDPKDLQNAATVERPSKLHVPQSRYYHEWTNEEDEFLRKHHSEGRSFSWIASAMRAEGWPISRNGAIGRAHRLHLRAPRKVSPPKPRNRSEAQKAKHALAERLRREERRARMAQGLNALPPAPIVEPPAIQESLNIPFFDIQHGQCRASTGDPHDLDTFRFCGLPTSHESSWCANHFRLFHQGRES